MTEAEVVCLALAHPSGDPISAWRRECGPTDSNRARQEAPQSVRALFGADKARNAVHGSDSDVSAARELGLIFGLNMAPVGVNTASASAGNTSGGGSTKT